MVERPNEDAASAAASAGARPAVASVAAARAKILARNALFANLPASDLEALAAGARERTMQRGETLFRRGDPGTFMLAVLAGEVRIALTGAAGRDQVLRLLKAGDVFGEMAMLDSRPRSADAVAATNGRLLVLERRDLLARMQHDPDFALRLLAILCDRLRATSAQLEGMLFHDSATRLAASLLGMATGRPQPRVDITQGALGEVIGATRETVNKKLREWEEQGWVALTPGRVTILDAQALAGLLPDG
jgi:CRP-like cAMP-binding protein